MTSVVSWRLDGDRLVRTETLSADRAVRLRRVRIAVPVTGADVAGARGAFVARGREGTLRVSARFEGAPVRAPSVRPADGAAGRGARLGIPVHVVYEAEERRRSRRTVRSGRRSCSQILPQEGP